jgi:hypothetical protein
MPHFRRNRANNAQSQSHSQSQSQSHSQSQSQASNENYIPFYNARLFAMHESLIQSYTHFTYHANYMFNVLEQSLHNIRTQRPIQRPWQPSQQPPQPWQPSQQPSQQPRQPSQQSWQPRTQPLQSQPVRATSATNVTNATNATNAAATTLENNIINALFGITNRAEPRLTQTQLNERVQYVPFGTIANPLNNICSITHDVFEPTQQVARIRHCGHIFNSTSLEQWLRINNTCPTCRHNLLMESRPAGAATNASSVRRNHEPTNVNINTLYNELLRNSANIPGFELNEVDDNSVVFSFDLTGGEETGPSSG